MADSIDPNAAQPNTPIREPNSVPLPERDPVTPDPYPVTDPVPKPPPEPHPDPDPNPYPHPEPAPIPTPPEPIPQYPPDVTF